MCDAHSELLGAQPRGIISTPYERYGAVLPEAGSCAIIGEGKCAVQRGAVLVGLNAALSGLVSVCPFPLAD